MDEVLKLRDAGAQLVDTRDAAEFAGAHLAGAINIGIDGKYATWAGTVLNKEQPIVVIADDERVEESTMRLGRIGFDHVQGHLEGGMDALRDHPELLAQVQRITAPACVNPPPKPYRARRSPRFSLPSFRANQRARGMVTEEVLPYSSTLVSVCSMVMS